MNLSSKISALEKAAGTADKALCCTVDFKAGLGPREKRMSRAAAIQAIQRGEVYRISFDLTPDEEKREREINHDALLVIREEIKQRYQHKGACEP